MSAEFLTEYHRNYCRPHEAPVASVRCGSPSSKLALTSEPCFKQKRKEQGHETRRTYTTDYVQYEDVNDLEEKDVPGDQAMRYKAGYRRVQFFPVSQYRLNYDWKSDEAPLELAAKQRRIGHHDENEQVETEECLPGTNKDRHPKQPAGSSSLEDVHRQGYPHRSPSPALRRTDGGGLPSHYRSPSANDRTKLPPRHSAGHQTLLDSHHHRSRSPGSHRTKPSSHDHRGRHRHDLHRHDHHHHGDHPHDHHHHGDHPHDLIHHGDHHHSHHHHDDHHHATDVSSRDPRPVLSSREVARDYRTDYFSKASEVVRDRRTGLSAKENRFANHQPREQQRRERKRLGGDEARKKTGKENREESSKKKTAKTDSGLDTTSLDEETNFYRRYQRSTAFPSPPRHRSSSHWTTEYGANYGSPLKSSYVNGVWCGAPSPERHLEDRVGQKKSQREPSSVAPPELEERPVVLQYSAPCNWFDQVVELREKAADYKERTRGNYFSRAKLKQLELAQQELQQRASSAFMSSSSSSSSPSCSRSSTPEPGGHASMVDNPETRAHLSPKGATTKLTDNFADLRVEDVESSADPLAGQRQEERRAVCTSGHSLPANRSAQPVSSSSPPPVSRLLRAPPVRPKASHGRVPTPELAQQQAADPSVIHRHHLDRTTPTKGNLLATIPHSLHLMGGSWKPPLTGKLTNAANSRNAAPPPGKSGPTRVTSARRAIFRDDRGSQGGSRHPPPMKSLGGLPGKGLRNVHGGMASEFTSSHLPSRTDITRPRRTTALEMAVPQPVPPSTISSHYMYPPPQPFPTSRLPPRTAHTSTQPTSTTDVATQPRSAHPHPRTLTTDPTHRSVAARPLTCCTGSTCETCGACLRAPSQAPPGHAHGTHFSRMTDGSSHHNARVDYPRGGASSTPAIRDPGNGLGSTHPPPIHEQNHALSLSSLSISSSCSVASDILERARHRRDHFWS